MEVFGNVEADIIKSYQRIGEILRMESLRELQITIRRPNQDDLSKGLAKEIERRLEEQDAEEYQETLKSKKDGLKPNERTQNLAYVAAENGQVSAKSVQNGIVVPLDTKDSAIKHADTFYRDEENPEQKFLEIVERQNKEVMDMRASLNDDENG